MSRAVQEDLSGLGLQERLKKRASNFKVWAYNSENGTFFGTRKPLQWGQLCLYYILFYLTLAAFTAIFFGVLGFMLPNRPIVKDGQSPALCSQAPNAINYCGSGPFFQALDLADVEGDTKKTDGIYKFGLCEPALSAIPRAMNLRGSEPVLGYTKDASRKGYQSFINTVNRVQCQPPYDDADINPECTANSVPKILPLVPNSPASDTNETKWKSPDNFLELVSLLDTDNTKPTPIYNFIEGGNTYETFMVFFKFNKVWNYQPYAVSETDGLKTNGLEAPIENNIGFSCSVSSPCTPGSVTARNAFNEEVDCTEATSSLTTSNGRVHIDQLTQIMVNVDGFPWRGGPLNMGLGSIALTYLKEGPGADEKPWNDFDIVCNMGVKIDNGLAALNASSPDDTILASSKEILNMAKPGPARAYSRSTGRTATIPVTL